MATVPPSNVVTLSQAAKHLGVHYMTAYRYVRLGRLPAEKTGGAWMVTIDDIERFQRDTGPEPLVFDGDNPVPLMTTALATGDEATAWAVVSDALQRCKAPAIHVDLLAPAMAAIGERWAEGTLSVAEEHRATVVAQRIVARLGSHFVAPGRKRGVAIIGAPEDDNHALPCALFADLVRSRGVAVIDLGAATPSDSFLEAVTHHDGAPCVCLTVTSDLALESARATVSALRTALPGTPIVVGGGAVTSRPQAMSLGSDCWSPDPATAADLVTELATKR